MRLERARGRGICRRSSMGKTKKTLKELEEEVCFLDSRRVFHRTEARHPPSLPLVAASEQQHLCALADRPVPVPSFRSQRSALEQEAYDEKTKLLNRSQFQELLELQNEEEPEFVAEIVEMYLADAKVMLTELSKLFSEEKVKEAEDGKPDYNTVRAVLHKLKGSSSTFGADGVQQKCEELREHCINEDLDKCRKGEGSLEELQSNVDILSEFLAKYTAKIKEIYELSQEAKADE